MGKAKIGEWLWRFLAGVMLFAVGWTIWIYSQLNPPALITAAAFEAADKAKAEPRQSTHGVIAPAVVPDMPKENPKQPPVNAEKLKFSDSLSAPEKK